MLPEPNLFYGVLEMEKVTVVRKIIIPDEDVEILVEEKIIVA